MTDSKEPSVSNPDEVNALLQSALDDFDLPPTTSEVVLSESTEPKKAEKTDPSKNFEKKFQELFLEDIDDPNFVSKMANLLTVYKDEASAPESETKEEKDGDVLSQAVKSMVENLEEIKDTVNPDMFQNGLDFGDLNEEGVFPIMQQMFQMIMSKEVLYPSLLAVKEKYPTWLEENKSKISEEENARYKKQYKIINKVCELFESENDSDPEYIKQKRFMELLPLLQEMTELGEPPKDFSESMPTMPMNGNFLNGLPNDMNPNNCNMM